MLESQIDATPLFVIPSNEMEGIAYIRVSSDEQVDGTSLETQELGCQAFGRERSVAILDVFRDEGASAKTADRPGLLRALEYCRKNRGKVQAFIVYKVDRLARNTEDHFWIRGLLKKYGVTLYSVTEPIGNSPTEKFVETVLAASSEFDNAIRRQRCTDGMIARINQGIWPWKSPLGYRSLQTSRQREKKTRPDPPHPDTFPLIQRALREYSKGAIQSQPQLARLLDQWGLSAVRGTATTPQLVDRLLGSYLNFYAGILVNPWSGEGKAGVHVAMITRDELARIRLVRSGKTRLIPRNRENQTFPLRRTALCTACHRPLTGSTSRGRSGRYPYYHCASRACALYGKALRKDSVEGAFIRFLDGVSIQPQYLRVFEATVLEVAADLRARQKSSSEISRERIAEIEARRRRVFEMREDGSYTKEMFAERRSALDDELAQARIATSSGTTLPRLTQQDVHYTAEFLSRLSSEWLAMPPSLRPRFQTLVLPDGIPYDREQGFGTAQLNPLLELTRPSVHSVSRLVDLMRDSWNRIVESIEELQALMAAKSSAAVENDSTPHEHSNGVSVAA